MAYVNAAMAVTNLYSGYQKGKLAKEQGGAQQQALNYQAGIEEANGQSMAAIIRRAGQRTVGAANAAYAAAGVKVGEGSALTTEGQIEQGVEHDAYQAILEGNRRGRGMRLDGVAAKLGGEQRATSAYVGAVSSAMSSFGKGVSGWKTGGATDLRGANGTNDASMFSSGVKTNGLDWWGKYGSGGD
jgi:hypothetical protein